VELAFARDAEVVGEDAGVHRRRHQHHSQVRPFRQQVSQHDEQKVLQYAPLVDLVHENVRHAKKRRVGRQPPEKHAGRAKLQPGAFFRDAFLQPDAVPHGLAHRLAALVRHALRHRDGAYPPRLRAHDARRRGAALGERALQNELGTLRGFAAAGLAGHHRDLVRGDRREERIAPSRRGETRARARARDGARRVATRPFARRLRVVYGGRVDVVKVVEVVAPPAIDGLFLAEADVFRRRGSVRLRALQRGGDDAPRVV
jgi:hypothetical protein